jgi:hypothetical protein
MTDFRNKETGKYDSYAFPGGYEIEYAILDGGILCAECANAEMSQTLDVYNSSWFIVGVSLDCHHDEPTYCDNCNHAFDVYGVLDEPPAEPDDETDYCNLCGGKCSIYPG